MEPKVKTKLLSTEDYWAIWLGLLVIVVAMTAFYSGHTIKTWAVTPGSWSGGAELAADLAKHWWGFGIIYLGFGAVFTLSMAVMGHDVKRFLVGYTILFVGSLIIFYLAAWHAMKQVHLGAPLLALLIGLVIGNVRAVPEWFKTALRTEYYIKTGIVLLGATLPLTLIFTIGPIAFLQATIVSVGTWLTIFLVATRLFKLDPRFGAVLGTGGAVCGVSGSIAVGGAVRADKEHISIGIAVVSVWAIVMILALTVLTKVLVAPTADIASGAVEGMHISPGVAGAWVGTSEYADAAGFAVVAELATEFGEAPIRAFTLMKVIGRDIWIGIWCLVLSIVSVVFWEKGETRQRLGPGVVWDRFPKFVMGFFVASVVMSVVAASAPGSWVGEARTAGTYKTKAVKESYDADFSGFTVPAAVADRFHHDAERHVITWDASAGPMSFEDQDLLMAAASTADQRSAIKQLAYRSDWFESELKSKAISPIKKLRSWAFVMCFLCIGLSTRFKELLTFGLKPFWAFTIGVAVNVPLGFLLSQYVFRGFWDSLK